MGNELGLLLNQAFHDMIILQKTIEKIIKQVYHDYSLGIAITFSKLNRRRGAFDLA